MDKSKFLFLGLLIAAGACSEVYFSSRLSASDSGENFSSYQKKEIERIVHDYLINQPEVIIKAAEAYQKKTEENLVQQSKEAVLKHRKELLDSNSPVLGNPKGEVAIVGFQDYRCPHCKEMTATIEHLIQENPNLKVVIKELPVLGPSSVNAAKFALASAKQNKYQEVHTAFLNEKTPLTEEKMHEILKAKGVDLDKLNQDKDSDAINQELTKTLELAHALLIQGTPFFVVMHTTDAAEPRLTIFRGAVKKEALQEAIQQAQKPK